MCNSTVASNFTGLVLITSSSASLIEYSCSLLISLATSRYFLPALSSLERVGFFFITGDSAESVFASFLASLAASSSASFFALALLFPALATVGSWGSSTSILLLVFVAFATAFSISATVFFSVTSKFNSFAFSSRSAFFAILFTPCGTGVFRLPR